jgi:short-subunit dehydrogenase
MSMSHFRDKVVVITGASSGIGRSLAVLLAKEKANVIVCARNEEKLKALVNELRGYGAKANYFVLDICDSKKITEVFSKIIEDNKRVDVLISNAGIGYIGPIESMPDRDIRNVMEVNFFGALNCIKAVIPQMKEQGGGKIAIVSSVVGKRGLVNKGLYSASKFALNGMSESLRIEIEDYGIKTILICPNSTKTPFHENVCWDGKTKKRDCNPLLMSSEKVAKIILKAIKKNKREVVISCTGKMLSIINFLFPKLADRIAKKIVKNGT